MNILESILTALSSIRSNTLRSVLTLLSISLGTFAIVSVGIATTTLNDTITGAIDEVGGNSFVIKRTPSINMGNSWRKYRNRKVIGVNQAEEYKKQIGNSALVSVADEDMGKTIKSGTLSTNPDVMIWGVDENYFTLRQKTFSDGRPILEEDLHSGRMVAVIGNDVKVKLFPYSNPIGQQITIDNYRFDIIGVLEPKGAVLGQSQDNEVYLPLTAYVKGFANESRFSATITVKANSAETFHSVFDESIGIMRSLRNCKPWEENNFEIEDNSTIKEQFETIVNFMGYFAGFIAFFALAAAGVGIMNIMLISVKERTREIGIRKALGATKNAILTQFLIEAVTLCQLGGLGGILFGLGLIGILSLSFSFTFSFPVNWVVVSIVICTVIGIAFGIYPAWRAARLDPIEALRYE
ncbi:MAG: ABC transporter permease [Candidatus Kapaibacterium sp.]